MLALKDLIMKTYKIILAIVFVVIELIGIVLFILKRIDQLSFILISMSMSLMLALYFMDRNKEAQKNKNV